MYRFLKKGRVVFSIIFLLIITSSFIFFINRETLLMSEFLKFQFVPSMLGIFSGGAIVFLLLLLLTILFGRAYCSTLCPLGTYQDIVSRTASVFKSKKNRRYSYDKPFSKLRFGILLIVGVLFMGGISLPLALLDPYSNWGKISNEIISRSEQYIHNGLAEVMPDAVFFRSYAHFAIGSFLFALFFLITVTLLSAFKGRLYCNTICPVGSFLGLLSRFAIFKPVIDKETCTKCRLCVINCKSQCIDLENQTVDESRCVACLNCTVVCKTNSIVYKYTLNRKKVAVDIKDGTTILRSEGRRNAMIAMGLMGTALAAKAINAGPMISSRPKVTGIAPPGAMSIEHLKKNCTACHACVAACPNNIIQPATTEYGIDGILLPVLNFKHHFCSYECNVCSQVCPNDALKPLSIKDKQLAQIGQTQFYLEKCIVHTDGTDCGACDEHCPTKAITMVPYGDSGLFIPNLEPELCIGCGACEYICPAVPEKAMVIHALEVHQIAAEPTLDKQEKVKVDDFGF
ncbi:MAG: 4Fe-4S binding protein [Bacteroidales bacterium]|nr:4Fe-4S binding protein [Bacteroidales bacterium]